MKKKNRMYTHSQKGKLGNKNIGSEIQHNTTTFSTTTISEN